MMCRTNGEKFLFEVIFGVIPGGHGIAEKEEIVDGALRIQSDDVANSSESTVFLLVIANVAQRKAPKTCSKRARQTERAPDVWKSPIRARACTDKGNLSKSQEKYLADNVKSLSNMGAEGLPSTNEEGQEGGDFHRTYVSQTTDCDG